MDSATSTTVYAPLPGRGRRWSARFTTGETQRLYLSGDHLVVLRRVGYEETSKRYSLSDIQAITVQSNADRAIASAVLSAVILLLAAVGLVVAQNIGPDNFVMFLLYGLVGALGFALMLNLALGPTCTVRLHTSVQIEDLTALRRQRAARKCLSILVPRIEAAQGGPLPGLAGETARASANAKQVREKKPPRAIGKSLHLVTFATAALFGLTCMGDLVYESASKDTADVLLFVAVMMLLLIAAIRQSNTTLPRQTCTLIWTLFMLNAIMFTGMMYTMQFISAFTAASSGESPPMITMNVVSFGGDDPRWVDMIDAVWGVVGLVLSLFGLFSIRGYSLVERPLQRDQGAPPS